MANNTSQHILNTSATLLGFCLIVITSLKIADKIETHIIDDSTSFLAVLLTLSCIFSFISIKTENKKREKRYETVADYIFVLALIGILIIILIITFNLLK